MSPATRKETVKLERILHEMALFPSEWTKLWTKFESEVRHDVEGFLRVVEYKAKKRDLATRFLHFGLTSSDVVDTTLSTLVAQSTKHLASKVLHLNCALVERSVEDAKVARVSRTHGQPAEVSTWRQFWYRAALQIESVELKPVYLYKVSGPTGEKKLDEELRKVRINFKDKWGDFLKEDVKEVEDATQVIPRHHFLGLLSQLEALSFACERIARDLRLYAFSSEFNEGFAAKQVGSSAMPHKKNPIALEKICGLGRLVRSQIQSLRSLAMELWLERDISNSSIERIAWPDIFNLLCHMTDSLSKVVEKGVIDQEFAQTQLKAGEIFAHEILNRLLLKGEFVHRSDAHAFVQSLCSEARVTGFPIQVIADRRTTSSNIREVVSSTIRRNTVESGVLNGKGGLSNRV